MTGSPPPLPRGPSAGSIDTNRSVKTSGLAIASLVLGVLSCGLSLLTGIPAIVCGAIGLNQIAKSKKPGPDPILTGQGLAVTGLVLGGMSLLVTPVLIGLLLPAGQSAREAARRTSCSFNMRGLIQGLLIAESVHRSIPTAIVDKDGRPLLSWRVAILPYIDEQALYQQFHLNEPWDSEHNRKLIPQMPAIFLCPSTPLALTDGKTTYQAATGPGTAFGDAKPLSRPAQGARLAGVTAAFPDGLSKTIVLLEMAPGDAVPWTKPEDFGSPPNQAAMRLFSGTAHAGGIHMVAFGDSSVRQITADVDPAVVAALLTKAGSELNVWLD